MRRALVAHPDSHAAAVHAIEASVERAGANLHLRYRVNGQIAHLALPAPRAPGRTDELWRTTCFEMFVRPGPGEDYAELNFSPSTQWAAYAFDAYRKGMRALDITPPRIESASSADVYTLDVHLAAPPAWREAKLALSAVIEDSNGGKTYWALTHPPGKPDFHHPASFTLSLPAENET